jgi:hypothetical protein
MNVPPEKPSATVLLLKEIGKLRLAMEREAIVRNNRRNHIKRVTVFAMVLSLCVGIVFGVFGIPSLSLASFGIFLGWSLVGILMIPN